MNQAHDAQHKHLDAQHKHLQERRPFHKDWRVWTAVILILAAMASYVLTNDEVLRPAPAAPPAAPSGTAR
jgi:hypothetical protein